MIQNKTLYLLYLSLSLLGAVGLGGALYLSTEVAFISAFLIGLNASCLFLMGLDKSLSRQESMRIPEVVFFILALFGGVPGILLGIQVFRHKIRKAGYQFVLLLIAAAQLYLARLFDISMR